MGMGSGLSIVNRFMILPGPARAGLALMAGGGLIAVMYMVLPRKYLWLVVIGIMVALLMLVLLRSLLKWRDKRKAKPFEQKIGENAGAAPQAVTDASAKARLDDLRRKFEEGITRFREHGKDIYSLPWYLLVGEPGSGKTEAIRHCNVGFPPGLQDQLQGAGGTLNMNWWFTNHAVILDTAGRLMFEEVNTGKTSEWREFLKMLRQIRPTCPINGLLLVIPADSLITDNAEDLERKGGKIAEQLDFIQKSLGVRFPVFVVITKCDLINGFREYFENLTDPQLQHQMVGWSNPADIDEPFTPDRVEEYLKTIAERLRKRRGGLLLDPVHTEDADAGRRIDEVDALYAFPDALLGIGHRLRRYLEMVFVAGEWSNKPLFLRGIYLTSSLQEGAELDAELAEALGMEVSELPEGEMWTKNSAYFLRDLFMNKVFREKGLVTAASNARQQQKRRRVVLLGTTIVAVLVLITLTWFSSQSFKQAIGTRTEFWTRVADRFDAEVEDDRPRVVLDGGLPGYDIHWEGDRALGGGLIGTKARLPGNTMEWADGTAAGSEKRTPWMFRWVARISGGLPENLEKQAHGWVLEHTALKPLVDATTLRLAEDKDDESWSTEASLAYQQLLRLKRGAAPALPEDAEEGAAPAPLLELRPLVVYTVGDDLGLDEQGRFDSDREESVTRLQEVFNWTYGPDGRRDWPPAWVVRGEFGDIVADALDDGAEQFGRHWSSAETQSGGTLAKARELVASTEALRRAEEPFLTGATFRAVETMNQYRDSAAQWRGQLEALGIAKARLDRAVSALGPDADLTPEELVRKGRQETLGVAESEYTLLLGELEGADDEQLVEIREDLSESLDALRAQVRKGVEGLEEAIQAVRADALNRPFGTQRERAYELRFAMYGHADEVVQRTLSADELSPSSLSQTMGSVERAAATARSGVGRQLPDGDEGSLAKAATTSNTAITAGTRRALFEAINGAMDRITAGAGLDEFVRIQAQDLAPIERPTVPMTRMDGGNFDAAYHPQAAASIFAIVEQVQTRVGSDDTDSGHDELPLDVDVLQTRFDDLRDDLRDYAGAYVRYWTQDVAGDLEIDPPDGGWPEMHAQLPRSREVNRVLRVLAQTQLAALELPAAVDRLMRSSDRDRIVAERRHLGRSIEALDPSDPFDKDLRDVLSEWKSLNRRADRARDTVLDLRQVDFQNDFLGSEVGVYDEPVSNAKVVYWSNMVLALTTSLADAANEEASRAFRSLKTDRRAFPLSRDNAARVLTRDDLLRAITEAEALGRAAASSGGAGDGETLGTGATVSLRSVDEQIRRLRGEEALIASDRKWLYDDLMPVIRWLRGDPDDDPQLPSWELVVLDSDYDANHHTAAGTFRDIEVTGGRGQSWKLKSDRGDPNSKPGFRLGSDASVVLRFSRFDGDGNPVEHRLNAPWSVLGPILSGKAQLIEAPGSEYDGLWAIPFRLTDQGESFTYWFGVKFDRPGMPKVKDWPVEADWPH